MKFRVVIEKGEDGKFVASCPTLPGCWSQGNTYNEARANIADAIQGILTSMKKHGDPIPGNLEYHGDAIVTVVEPLEISDLLAKRPYGVLGPPAYTHSPSIPLDPKYSAWDWNQVRRVDVKTREGTTTICVKVDKVDGKRITGTISRIPVGGRSMKQVQIQHNTLQVGLSVSFDEENVSQAEY
ncbi:MAG: type II toxin-antitoxin system HicB family antitoxin [Phycisphaeraceae bacterium]